MSGGDGAIVAIEAIANWGAGVATSAPPMEFASYCCVVRVYPDPASGKEGWGGYLFPPCMLLFAMDAARVSCDERFALGPRVSRLQVNDILVTVAVLPPSGTNCR